MNTKLSNERGSIVPVIAGVLVVTLLGAMGYMYWTNVVNKVTSSDKNVAAQSPKPTKKSEIIAQTNSDMNKYVNYEKGFEFQFPKQITTNKECKLVSKQSDYYGNLIDSEPHYLGNDGNVAVILLENNDEFIIAPKTTVIQTDAKGTPSTGYIFKGCKVVPTTLDVLAQAENPTYDLSKDNLYVETRSINVVKADSEEAALGVAKDLVGSSIESINWKKTTDREEGTLILKEDTPGVGLNFAYKFWFYPQQKKVVYIQVGQSVSMQYPDGKDKYYFPDLIDTFKFIN